VNNPVGESETPESGRHCDMLADNARGSGNAPCMALPTICAGRLAVDEHHRSIRDSLRQLSVAIYPSRAPEDNRI